MPHVTTTTIPPRRTGSNFGPDENLSPEAFIASSDGTVKEHMKNGCVKVSRGTKNDTNDKFGDFTTPIDMRPAPLVSITTNPIRNKLGYIGAKYNITLNGTILGKVDSSNPDNPQALDDIFKKQRAIEDLFSGDTIKLEVDHFGDGNLLTCYPKLESINFEEGTYYQICRYSINLVAEELFDENDELHESSKMQLYGFTLPAEFKDDSLEPIEDFNESWSFDTVEGQAYAIYENDGENIRPKTFTVSRTLSCTARDVYNKAKDTKKPAWEHARDFIEKYHDSTTNMQHMMNNSFLGIARTSDEDAPYPNQTDKYKWYNNVRSESIDKAAGSYQLVDQWTLAPSANRYLETFNVSISQGNDSNRTTVSIDGTITGLETWTAGKAAGDDDGSAGSAEGQGSGDKYDHAEAHYRKISANGLFGTTSWVYKRANQFLDIHLNGSPVSLSIGSNRVTGEITYNVQYDNRPTNYFDQVTSETITVNDTYPGDVYAVIPVLGRPTGPILQYAFGRTEYKRDLSIEFILDANNLGYQTSTRNGLLYTKPSLTAPYKSQIDELIGMMSPASEPGVRKYFLNPPQETWNPKEGRYTLNCSWTYEVSE